MRESLTARTLKGAAWIGGASIARLALRVVSVAILARLLTPHEYGVVAGALIAMDFAAMIYGMGLAPTLVQRKEVRPDHVATAFSSALFMAVLAAVGMWFAAPLIADLIQIPELTQILKVLAAVRSVQRALRGVACPQHAGQEGGDAPPFQLHDLDLPRCDPDGLVRIRVLVARRHAGGRDHRKRGDARLCGAKAPGLATLLAPGFCRALAPEPWVHDQSTLFVSRTER
jgi:hypothetical protein